MLRSIPFHPNINLNLSFSITHAAMDVSLTLSTLYRHLMRTSTEFISEISAPTISTSCNFHLFDFLAKGRKMCIVCVCVFALLSRSLVTPRH